MFLLPVSPQLQVNRAIEQTKSRQQGIGRAPTKQQNSPGRTETIDVDKLNQLIRALDKTWILPRLGAREPVGSNFQYKKTCASIFKARHGACQQLGFGVMCFNYCHERGEKLTFRCQDASDAAYCRQSGTFETFIAKYRKDGYKAKAYIHQMNRHRLLTRGPKSSKPRATSTTTAAPEETEYVEIEEEKIETTTRKRPVEKKRTTRARPTTTLSPVTVTASRSNIWDRFTVSQNSKVSSKYIPFWKRLLSTTISPPKSVEEITEASVEVEVTPEPSVEEEVEEVVDVTEIQSSEATTPVEDIVSTKRPVQKTNRNTDVTQGPEQTTEREKHTFKPLPMTVPPSQGPELAFQKAGERGPGFWNRFQPNRWFESIHYVTNTGK
ncbi:hypothetical protein RB195_012873 [Necator americanus]|uniref:Uncharacterized protein n=1 Tax=Necator americanus TaxID=51031 RepID=A0ABR1DUE3_NECAM